MPDIRMIQDLHMPELQPYVCTSEVQLLRRFEPEPGLFIAESPKVVGRALDAGYEPLSLLVEKRLLEAQEGLISRCGDVPVFAAELDVLRRIIGFNLTQGVLCAMRRRKLPGFAAVCQDAARIAVLEDVMNPANLGAVFRSAAALGFDAVLLTGGCSDPLYRRCIRVSMGTVFQIPWAVLPHTDSAYVGALKEMGYTAVAMALRDDSIRIDDPRLAAKEKLAVLLGTEGEGLRGETIAACDHVVTIPMARGVDSLNVAAAGAVAFWQLGKR